MFRYEHHGELSNKWIIFHMDNQALVEVINEKTTTDKELLVGYEDIHYSVY